MVCPSLQELPPAPTGKTGWPWTEESVRSAGRAIGLDSCPRITLITPSFNQGQFIEETIRSILLQGYPNLEYFILDGGSSDETVAIIEKYSRWIDFWVSEPDHGQSSAINRGLRMASGIHANWINSDDMLYKNALTSTVMSHGLAPDVVYVGDCLSIDAEDNVLFTHRGRVRSFEELLRIRTVWHAGGSIDQPATLFPLEIALQVGGLNEANHYAMDYELWGDLLLAGVRVEYTEIPFGFFRWHDGQKSQSSVTHNESMFDAAEALLARAGVLSKEMRQTLLADLLEYRKEYPERVWRQSGRLARTGLPRSIVIPIRYLKQRVEKTFGSFRPGKYQTASGSSRREQV
jgi:glycosyltransferase involved in cell wall biosynthesis